MSICKKADELVDGDRQEQYADPVKNFVLISELATRLLARPVSAADCAKVMLAVKLSREAYKHKEDNLVDLCGYAEILNRIESISGASHD